MTSSAENATFKPFLCTIQCAVCSSPYRQLKLLQCYHSCCLKCLEDKGEKINCPKCQFKTDLTMGFNLLPENCLQKSEGLVEVLSGTNTCKACRNMRGESANVPSHVCFECMGETLCDECHTFHENAQDTQCHTPVAIADIFDSAVDIADQMSSVFNSELCMQHPNAGEVLNFYCRSCSLLVCHQCMTESHVGHACPNVGEVGQEKRDQFATQLQSLKLKLSEITTAISDHEWRKGDNSKLTDLEALKIRIQDTISFVDLFRKMASNTDVIKHGDALTHHLTKLNQMDVITDNGLDDVKPSSTQVQPSSAEYRNVIEVKASDVPIPSTAKKMHIGSIVTAVEDVKAGNLSEVTMKEYSKIEVTRMVCGLCINEHNEVCALVGKFLRYFSYKGEQRGTFKLKLRNPFDMKCVDSDLYVTDCYMRVAVKMAHTGKMIRRFDLPEKERKFRGCPCSVAVSDNGKVYSSSCATCVIYHCEASDNMASQYISKKEEKPLKHNPYCITLADNGDLIVATSKSLMAINTQTKDLIFNTKKYGDAHGVCTDALGHIYLADYSKSRITVLDSTGEFITHILTKKDHGIKNPRRVCISPDGEYLAISHKDCKIALFKLSSEQP